MDASFNRRDFLIAAGATSVAMLGGCVTSQTMPRTTTSDTLTYRSARELLTAVRPRRYRSARPTAFSNRDSVGCEPSAGPASGSRSVSCQT
jgi:hypothetical protein